MEIGCPSFQYPLVASKTRLVTFGGFDGRKPRSLSSLKELQLFDVSTNAAPLVCYLFHTRQKPYSQFPRARLNGKRNGLSDPFDHLLTSPMREKRHLCHRGLVAAALTMMPLDLKALDIVRTSPRLVPFVAAYYDTACTVVPRLLCG